MEFELHTAYIYAYILHGTGPSLVQVKACYLCGRERYLNQWWFIVKRTLQEASLKYVSKCEDFLKGNAFQTVVDKMVVILC